MRKRDLLKAARCLHGRRFLRDVRDVLRYQGIGDAAALVLYELNYAYWNNIVSTRKAKRCYHLLGFSFETTRQARARTAFWDDTSPEQ